MYLLLDKVSDHVAMSKFLAANRDRGHGDTLTEHDYDAMRLIQKGVNGVELPDGLRHRPPDTAAQPHSDVELFL